MIALKFYGTTVHPGALELLQDVLLNAGVTREQIVEETGKRYRCVVVYFKHLAAAQRLKQKIASWKLKGVRSAIALLKDADWKTRWKKYFKPFKITPEIRIVPYVQGARLPKKAPGAIYIDTTASFGTGLHATTRMMAGFIRGAKGKFQSFLDLGTGSGILAAIACSYGAHDLWAIDIDKEAVKTARRNLQVNGCRAGRVTQCAVERFAPRRNFDFVAANLLTEDLLRLQRVIARFVCRGGLLAISGIYADNYRLLRKGFKPDGFRCVRVASSRKWYALLFQRTA